MNFSKARYDFKQSSTILSVSLLAVMAGQPTTKHKRLGTMHRMSLRRSVEDCSAEWGCLNHNISGAAQQVHTSMTVPTSAVPGTKWQRLAICPSPGSLPK